MLPSFEVENFRTFSHLQIPHLGGVNLIVGRNNVGKTMLLEALRLYACGGHPAAIAALLVGNDEVVAAHPASFSSGSSSGPYVDDRIPLIRLETLFFRRVTSRAIMLRSAADEPASVRIQLGVFRRVFRRRDDSQFLSESYEAASTNESADNLSTFEALTVFNGGHQAYFRPYISSFQMVSAEAMDGLGPAFVAARVADSDTLTRQWDAIALREEAEKRVIQCLGLIAPVSRITTIQYPGQSRRRMFVTRLEGEAEPMPLNAAGDGMVRVFQMAVALESARSTSGTVLPLNEQPLPVKPLLPMLLIDEIENGIHWTVLPDLWRFVLRAARLHGVQVFATTHSWDCVEAFQKAAAEDTETDGTLIRLEQRYDCHKAVTFSEKELAIVTRDKIEVR